MTRISENLKFRYSQMIRWYKMFSGTSYYHLPQNFGKCFVPSELKGYFNDVTGKTKWQGRVDSNGVPVNLLSCGGTNQFPIMITQKALGHWDCWMMEGGQEDKEQFLILAQWLIDNQEENGAWNTWQVPTGETFWVYSAMTQGQAMSVLTRAFTLTNDDKYQVAAKKAFEIFRLPIENAGVTYRDQDKVVLEEFPSQKNSVLNGWVFAIFGLYDFNLVFDKPDVREMLNQTLETLSKTLPQYDMGYWSRYDLIGRVASPFYHNLHIGHLKALSLISDNPVFESYHQRWLGYQNAPCKKLHALVVKAIQKIKEPAQTTIK